MRVARIMRQFPALDRAMANGDISYAKARVLASCLTPDNATVVSGSWDRHLRTWPVPPDPSEAALKAGMISS